MKQDRLPPTDWYQDLNAVSRRLQALVATADTGALSANRISAAKLYKHGQRRHALFGEGLFADPAWDILLDLYAQRERGKWVSVSSACISAQVPQATGLRHLQRLVDRQLVIRRPDPDDRRRIYVALSDEAATTMATFLAEW